MGEKSRKETEDMRAIIFGWGKYGKALKRGLEKYYGIEFLAICDNDEKKCGGGGWSTYYNT